MNIFNNIMRGVHQLGYSAVLDDLNEMLEKELPREEQVIRLKRCIKDIETIKSEQKIMQ